MVQVVLIGIGAGAATALLFASVASGSPLSVPLFYLAPLPILIAAMGWSHWAALIAAVVAAAGLAAVFGCVLLHRLPDRDRPAGVVARLSRAAGAAGRRRPAGSNGIRSAIWCSGPRSSAPAIVIAGDPDSRHRPGQASARRCAAASNACCKHPGAASPAESAPTRAPADRLIDFLVAVLPPAAAVLATITNVVNLWLAERIVKVSGRLRRPPSDLSAMRFPAYAPALAAVAIAASFLPGIVGIVGRRARREPADGLRDPWLRRAARDHARHGQPALHARRHLCRRPVFGWPVLVMSLLGLADTAFDLRGRAARTARPTQSSNLKPENDHGSDFARTRRQARPDGRSGARQGRLRAQLPAAQGQGAARDRGQQVQVRGHEGRPAGQEPRDQGRGRQDRRQARRQEPSRSSARPRRPASSTARCRRAISPPCSPTTASRSIATRSRSTCRSRPSASTRCRCSCIRRSRSRSRSMSRAAPTRPSGWRAARTSRCAARAARRGRSRGGANGRGGGLLRAGRRRGNARGQRRGGGRGTAGEGVAARVSSRRCRTASAGWWPLRAVDAAAPALAPAGRRSRRRGGGSRLTAALYSCRRAGLAAGARGARGGAGGVAAGSSSGRAAARDVLPAGVRARRAHFARCRLASAPSPQLGRADAGAAAVAAGLPDRGVRASAAPAARDLRKIAGQRRRAFAAVGVVLAQEAREAPGNWPWPSPCGPL